MNPPLALGLFGVATMLQCRLTGPPLARLSCRTGAQPAMQPATAIRHGWALARPARPCSRAAFGDRREVETGLPFLSLPRRWSWGVASHTSCLLA